MVRELTQGEVASKEFARLLWLAVEVDDAELARIARTELPRLEVIGIVGDDRVQGFAAFDSRTDPVTIEYIAVDERARGRGAGTALVAGVRDAAGGRALYAQTDDDAVAFYRRLGFAIEACEPDPRWPDRQRYDCVLSSADDNWLQSRSAPGPGRPEA